MADVEAPPVPNRSYPLCEPPPGVVSERLTFMVSTLVFGVVLIGFCYLLGITWLVITFLVFFSFAEVVLFFGRNAPVGTCPFCGGLIQRYNRVRPEPVRCQHCSEISKLENERLSPYDPNAVAETPIFQSPAFENGVWPNACVQCGAPPTRFDDPQAVRYQARRLATPLVSSIYLPHPAARVTGGSLLRATSRSHSSDPAEGDVCLDSMEICAGVCRENGGAPESVSNVALTADDEALSGSEPARAERRICWLSRAEPFAEDGLCGVYEVRNTGAERRCPAHQSHQIRSLTAGRAKRIRRR